MHSIFAGAKTRNIPISITIKYIWKLFLKQKRRCALSGTILSFEGGATENRHASTSKRTASLDRIDSSKGYVKGNVQWIHKDLNMMKQRMPNTQFINWCKTISDYQTRDLTTYPKSV